MPPITTAITTTATTDALPLPMAERPGIEVVYESTKTDSMVAYTVEPHPPTPRDAK